MTENAYRNIPPMRRLDIEYLAILIAKNMRGEREFIGQTEASKRFGRNNIERWVKEMKIKRYKRPGKIEYRLEEIYRCALNTYDY